MLRESELTLLNLGREGLAKIIAGVREELGKDLPLRKRVEVRTKVMLVSPDQLNKRIHELLGEDADLYSEDARAVVYLADGEARNLEHNSIGTEHLLLGLTKLDSPAAQILNDMGVYYTRTRAALELTVGSGGTDPTEAIGLTPRFRTALHLAANEAKRLNHSQIDSPHLLLGMVREGGGIAANLLEGMGVNLDHIGQRVGAYFSQSGAIGPQGR